MAKPLQNQLAGLPQHGWGRKQQQQKKLATSFPSYNLWLLHNPHSFIILMIKMIMRTMLRGFLVFAKLYAPSWEISEDFQALLTA